MTKKNGSTIKSWEEADVVIKKIAVIDSYLQKHEAIMNTELQKITDKYDALTRGQKEEKLMFETNLKLFGETRKKDFIGGKKKSLKLLHGVVGFKFNKPSVGLISKAWTMKKSLILLQSIFGRKFIRMVPEINKEAIIKASTAKVPLVSAADLAEAGLVIKQDEGFYYKIDWKKIEAENRKAD